MEINLEKIELVKEKTGATYAQAKAALEKAEGSVVDAIIDLEEELNEQFDEVKAQTFKDSPVFQKMKEIVDKGNISKIVVRKNDKDIVHFPVTIGVAGAVIVPWVVIVGTIAAIGYDCEILFVDDKGQEINLEGKAVGVYDKAAAKATDAFGKFSKAAGKAVDKAIKAADEVVKRIEK